MEIIRMAFEIGLLVLIGILLYQLQIMKKDDRKKDFIIERTSDLSRKMYELGREEDFIENICDTVQTITQANEFTYFRYNPEEHNLTPQYIVGPYKEQLSKMKVAIGEGFTGFVAKERKGMFLNNANKSPVAKHVQGTPNEDSSLLAIPITFSSDLLGVVLQTKLGGATFTKEELRLSEIFVNLTAAFIAGENYVKTVRQGFVEMLKVLINTVELKDTYTAGHSKRVSRISELIAEEMNLPEKEVAVAKIGGLLHDIGKIGVQEIILRKNGILEDWEIDEIKDHPVLGAKLVGKFSILNGVPDAILHHHEWFDGTGYPDKLKGEDIPITSRIISVADAIDAMTSGRPGRELRVFDEALAELRSFEGTQFDKRVVSAAYAKRDEILAVLKGESEIEEPATEEDFTKLSS
ncbi:MAG: HD domain-containing phosphohydrolase [Caldisericaceae bacterium]